MTCKEFLSHCAACGGNWLAMCETGMAKLFPEQYKELLATEGFYKGDGYGLFAFSLLCDKLKECGVVFE